MASSAGPGVSLASGRGITAAHAGDGRTAVVTGVSRRQGIGFAVARRLLADGARVVVQSWVPHDDEQPWGADAVGPEVFLRELEAVAGADRVLHVSADFADPAAPAQLLEVANREFGTVDVIVANHARSSSQDLEQVTATELDLSFAVNTRATVLLVQAFAAQHDNARPGGRVVLFTSGQHLGPMPGELPYVLSKGAIHQVTASLADHLAPRDITVNTVNPGPTDTGWATGAVHDAVQAQFPDGRWNTAENAAAVVAWLVSADAGRITGQIIDAEGGFRR